MPSALSVSTSIHADIPKRKRLSSCAFLSGATKQRNLPPQNANASRARARASFASSAKNEFLSFGTLLGFAHPNPARFDFISQFCSRVAKEKLFRCICTGIVFCFFICRPRTKSGFLDRVYAIIKMRKKKTAKEGVRWEQTLTNYLMKN